MRPGRTGGIKSRALLLLAGIGLCVLLAGPLLDRFKLDLVFQIVTNALVQKAPPGESSDRIRQVLARAREEAVRQGNEDRLLEELLRVSQRLEKIQSLESDQLAEILHSF